ncbi:hypothetical protein DM01DRAFT_1384259 [Hesseltinella vesiculosa]|uniref:Uncharacterized protein n=1 Tax=Hesseltinella vesiculosa TaxID=101127 RepID=A0A1X2GEQ6_9FUNG|nr:hypothetical protein DM01DRAFT_1384259 [Hesseltinella vesiculosa]
MHSTLHTNRKRKLSEDHTPFRVRFSSTPQVMDTYSPSEYDRSGLFPDVPPLVLYPKIIPSTMPLPSSLSPLPSPPATCLPSPPIEEDLDQQWLPAKRSQRKKPKLTIDTSAIQGPLFFTELSTNHQKKSKLSSASPISARPASPLTSMDDDPIEQITLKNTEMNRRCCMLVVVT